MTYKPRPTDETGTLSSRPAANTRRSDSTYFASDENGGTLYKTNGSTWTKQAPGISEIGGKELNIASSIVNFVTSSTTLVDIPSLTTTVTIGIRPVEVIFSGCFTAPSAGGVLYLYFMEGAVEQFHWTWQATGVDSMTFSTQFAPTAGAHTYKMQAKVSSGANGGFYGVVTTPAQLRIIER